MAGLASQNPAAWTTVRLNRDGAPKCGHPDRLSSSFLWATRGISVTYLGGTVAGRPGPWLDSAGDIHRKS